MERYSKRKGVLEEVWRFCVQGIKGNVVEFINFSTSQCILLTKLPHLQLPCSVLCSLSQLNMGFPLISKPSLKCFSLLSAKHIFQIHRSGYSSSLSLAQTCQPTCPHPAQPDSPLALVYSCVQLSITLPLYWWLCWFIMKCYNSEKGHQGLLHPRELPIIDCVTRRPK